MHEVYRLVDTNMSYIFLTITNRFVMIMRQWRYMVFCVFSNIALQWRHNDHGGVSNHQPHDCLLNLLFGRRSKKTSKLRVTGLCVDNSPVTGEFPAQIASNAENVSTWWRHHHCLLLKSVGTRPANELQWLRKVDCTQIIIRKIYRLGE